jgi:murein L,D-transpeptidase YcbB/YkuD
MQLELLMTDAVYSFMLNLCAGYQSIDNEVSQGIRESILGALQQGIETGNLQTAILSVQPSFVEYTRLQQATRRFVEKSDLEGNWPDVADPRKDSVLFEKQLKQILLRMDYIEAGADRVSVSEGLKRFQHFHGLQADGRPGKNTVDALRMPALLRYKMLALNLDRLRKQENGCSHLIYVNIPSFTLKVFHNNTFKDAYRVIVGKPDSPTPKLVSSIDRIIANPVWYVPSSITMKEIIPKIQSDTTYLERNGFRFIDRHNQAVNDEDIDFSDLSSTGFNYTLRQEAGSDNALGKIKFVFSNPYSVYMHDTPGKGLFSKDLRAFSHGCIRLEDPRKLADYLVRSLQADTAGIKDAMDRGEYREITLSSPIPIHISYITCVADDSLNLYFYKDIYGYDQQEMSDMEALLTQNMSDILAIR